MSSKRDHVRESLASGGVTLMVLESSVLSGRRFWAFAQLWCTPGGWRRSSAFSLDLPLSLRSKGGVDLIWGSWTNRGLCQFIPWGQKIDDGGLIAHPELSS